MNPAQWTLSTLESLNTEDLFQLTLRVISTLGVSRVLLGRCLLTIDAADAAGEVGCSGSIHYAGLHGVDHREAREARRVARCLEELPVLRKAAEVGAIDSEAEGRPVTFKEHLSILWVQHLTGSYSEESTRNVWENAARDVAAQRPARVEEAPWAAVAAVEEECPESPGLSLVQAAPIPHWTNERLRFNGEARALTPAQRQEVLRRDGYCCATPGCPNHLWMEVHHIVFYSQKGATVPPNLVIACSICHRNIHKGLLRVTGTAPDGLLWANRLGSAVGGSRVGEWLGLLNTS